LGLAADSSSHTKTQQKSKKKPKSGSFEARQNNLCLQETVCLIKFYYRQFKKKKYIELASKILIASKLSIFSRCIQTVHGCIQSPWYRSVKIAMWNRLILRVFRSLAKHSSVALPLVALEKMRTYN
jgi:hypothetical protein